MSNDKFEAGVPYTITFTDDEWAALKAAAKAQGYDNVTDYLNANHAGTWSTPTEKE